MIHTVMKPSLILARGQILDIIRVTRDVTELLVLKMKEKKRKHLLLLWTVNSK